MRAPWLLAATFLAPPALAQTQVLVVDPAGSGEFSTIAGAVAAAQSGDIVLLRPADYFVLNQAIVLDGTKSLAVVADGADPIRMGSMSVDGLGAGLHVLIQGMNPETIGGARDTFQGCAGPVWLERCDFEHTIGGVSSVGGVEVASSAAVVFTHCLLRKPIDLFFDPEANALAVLASRVHLHGGAVAGIDEGVAAVLGDQGSTLEIFGTTILGGTGASGSPFFCNGTNGGIGLELRGVSRALALGAIVQGGAGGAPFGACTPGTSGAAVVLGPGSTFTTIPGAARDFRVSSPVRDDELVPTTFRGQPGDGVWLAVSTVPMPGVGASFRDGELLVGAPLQVVFAGTIPAGGTLAVQVAAPTLPAGEEGAVFFGQAFFRDAQTRRFLVSAPSALVLVDDAF